MERFFAAFARTVLRHRLLFAGLIGIALAVAGLGALKLEVAFSFQSFVGSRDASIQVLRDHIDEWGSDDATLFVVVEHPDGLLDDKRLSALEATLVSLENAPEISGVMGLPRVPLLEAGSATIGAQTIAEVVAGAPDSAAKKAAKASILSNKRVVPLLLSDDATATAILARLNVDADDITAYRPVVVKVRALLDAEEERTGLRFAMAGIPAVRSEFVDQLIADQSVFMSIALACVLLLLVVLFRSFHGIVIPLVAALIPTAILFGIMGWSGEPIGILSQVYVTLIPVIALADTIHVVTRYQQECRAIDPSGTMSPTQRTEAIAVAMSHTGAACLFTSVTTMIGFFSLFVADMQVLHAFGLYAGIGVGIAFFCLLIVLPIGLSFVRSVGPQAKSGSIVDDTLGAVGAFSVRHPAPVLAVTVVICAVAVWLGAQVRVDNRLNDVLGDKHDVSRANTVVDAKLGGVVTVQVALKSKDGGLGEPKTLAAIDALERALGTLKDVRAVRGPASTLRTLNVAVVGEDTLPTSPAHIAQLWLLVGEAAGANAVLFEDLNRGRIILHMSDLGGAKMEALAKTIEPAIATAFPEGGSVEAVVTGVNWVAYKSFNRLSRELLWSLLSALGFICLLITFLFRSVFTALMSMVPNVVPLLLTLATMGAMGWRLDPPSSVVFVVALGIAVDDTIHLLARVFEELRRLKGEGVENPMPQAVERAVVKTGRAIAITTALLVVGFGVNSFSSFPMNRVFGVLGGVAVFSALWCDVLVLPALLSLVDRLRRLRNARSTTANGQK